ncbi:hemolysin type calcium-binding protein [Methylobacter tundripaludum]|uniref:Hemolysin type calcium-binding protein n=1 Tax=Methylobacter tundripaludum TaxID=173365 RepID=A0A2S6H3P2_9GAMM|nr:hemolysin type calcium-binding protein [Methylobacter tundripaludum]
MLSKKIYGSEGADTLTGPGDNSALYGLGGDDIITATAGGNIIYGGDGNDTVTFGSYTSNTIEGGAGNDLIQSSNVLSSNSSYANTFTGGTGNDRMVSGGSADTYLFNRGDGQDSINDNSYVSSGVAGLDKLVFGAGITANDINAGRNGNNLLLKLTDRLNPANTDQITIENWWSADTYRIENFQFADGTSLTKTQLTQMVGTTGGDNLIGTDYADTLAGLDGNDVLNGNAGNDILQGGNGNDILNDTAGTNLLDGGMGVDTLTGVAGNELFAGGAGNDIINTGDGADVVVFNRNDGQDILNGGIGTDNTLSLGGGIQYSDLALSKSGNDLILEVGNSDQITLSDWYNTTANHKSVLNLQVIADVMAGFDPASSDPLLNKSIQNYDFTAIVNAFDQANGGSANFMHWSATDSLLTAHLSAGDSEALGGDLANQYGKNGNFSGFSQTAAQDVLSSPAFGANPQLLHDLAGLSEGIARLS